jgi:L-ascorbate metabolism protein UlaG (beta-lactamase superfamily)
MKDKQVKINYLYHSGFSVETENYLLIFDYFKDEADIGEKNIANGAVGSSDLAADKKIIVFSSHSHGDHFNPVILEWRAVRQDIEYVLSDDIVIKESSSKLHKMGLYERLQLGDVTVKSYGSTDIGISFMVYVDGVNIFHAGDLNWWYWWDDTEEEIEKAETWFKSEVDRIIGEDIDVAFFPVDQRLEHNYCVGAKYFMNKLTPKFLVPMHFGDVYETTSKFKSETEGIKTKVFEISKRGQEFKLTL